MSMDQGAIDFPGKSLRLHLRELNGFDEQSISGVDTATAINLIDRLLVRSPGSPIEHFNAAELTASERDRLLAEVYERTFGPRIESTVRCGVCQELFDLTFAIRDLLASLDSVASSPMVTRDPDGTYRTAVGLRFRLPVGTDELAVIGLPPQKAQSVLLQRCILESNEPVEIDAVQEAMENVAPVMNLDLDARCPECGGKQQVHFDIQFYLLRALLQESKRIGREIHRLAVAYGWSLNEILSLSRSQRQAFVEFIESDFSRRARSYS
jgi:hypothetical protein